MNSLRRIGTWVAAALAIASPTLPAQTGVSGTSPAITKGRPPDALDPRVAPDLQLGSGGGSDSQAEPYVVRSAANPEVVLATFQEGRYAGNEGGALDCAYALSKDGGFTWTRALIPNLTSLSGGSYFRSTDPVSAIGPEGNLYLSNLNARDAAFDTDDMVVSRSTDNGATWSNHIVYSTPGAQVFADKDWLVVNDFPGTAHPGRLLATFTLFTVDGSGNLTSSALEACVSDDQGTTWSKPSSITPADSYQGTQPLFLPDGSVVCVYYSSPNATTTNPVFQIESRRSLDGGSTWSSNPAVIAANQFEYDDPVARDGGGLPGAAVARNSGALLAVWQARDTGDSEAVIRVSKSTDSGVTWSPPAVVASQPTTSSLFNPAVAVSPDGQVVTVTFYDKQLAPGANYVDVYMAQSFDGGATWQQPVRISNYTTDLTLAPLDDTGRMLGDYMGVAPGLTPTQGAIAIWCDTRSGVGEPIIARIAQASQVSYSAWQSVRFTTAQLASPAVSGPLADPDGDGYPNLAEYAMGTEPLVAEQGAGFVAHVSGQSVDLNWSTITAPDLNYEVDSSVDGGATWKFAASQPVTADSFPTGNGNAFVPAPSVPTLYRLSFIQNGTGATAAVPELAPAGGSSRLANLSTRASVGSGASTLIAGFVVGSQPKNLLVRAAGPSLAAFGVADAISDPILTVQGTATLVDQGWQNAGEGAAIQAAEALAGAFLFAPGSHDSALVATLQPGTNTASITAAPASTGVVALAEVYDLDDPGAPGRLLDVSTRAQAGSGDSSLIAGFSIEGNSPKQVLIRAAGPSLAAFSVANVVPDPQIQVRAADGSLVASNDDWGFARNPAITTLEEGRTGAFLFDDYTLDCALVLTLAPGTYTVVVTGVGGTTGNALVEVYDAD